MATTQNIIEVDPQAIPGTSDYESISSSAYDSSTVSLTSSIYSYITENGRRYHTYFGQDKSLLPCDEIEKDRLDMNHEIFLQLMDGLHLAPITKAPHRILDVGTGTGIWAIEMAEKYPMAVVTGTDLTPIQPAWVPSNCKFEIDDAELPWTHDSSIFDFIHARNIAQGITSWSNLATQMFRCTAPSGYVELVEGELSVHSDDGTMADDNPMKVHTDLLSKGLEKMGRPAFSHILLKKSLEEAGFVDVTLTKMKQPLGVWPKDPKIKKLGALVMMNCQSAFHSYGMAVFTRVLGLSDAEAKKLCDEAVAATRNRNFHCYNYVYSVYGRKPKE